MNASRRTIALAVLLLLLVGVPVGFWLGGYPDENAHANLRAVEESAAKSRDASGKTVTASKTEQSDAVREAPKAEPAKPPEPRWQPPRFLEGYLLAVEMFANGRHAGVLLNDFSGNRERTLGLLLSADQGASWRMVPVPVSGGSNFCSAGAVLEDGSAAVLVGGYFKENERKNCYDLFVRRKDAFEAPVRIWEYEGNRGAFRPEVLGVGSEFWAFALRSAATALDGKTESTLEAARIARDGTLERLPPLKGAAHRCPVVCALDSSRVGACVWRTAQKDLAWGSIAWGQEEWDVRGIATFSGGSQRLTPLKAARQGSKVAVVYSGCEEGAHGYSYWVVASSDEGKTWQTPYRIVQAHQGDMVKITIGWQGERLYAFYLEEHNGVPLTAVFSDDLGKTWTPSRECKFGGRMKDVFAANTTDTLYVVSGELGQRGTTITGWLGIRAFCAAAWDEPRNHPAWYKPASGQLARKSVTADEDF